MSIFAKAFAERENQQTHKTPKKIRGDSAEKQAELFLMDKGFQLITRNFHCKLGEIDLIMQDEDTLVFVEVRYRKNATYGSALESIDHKKQLKIIATAEHYRQKHPKLYATPLRFDVVGITGTNLQWIASAFQGQ